MNGYKFDTIVSKTEADALKDMIFKRARERAESLQQEAETSYTSAVKNDIMDLARDSFVSSKNPFSQKEESRNTDIKEEKKPEAGLGFPNRSREDVQSQINYRNNSVNKEIAGNEIESAMTEARADFSRKNSFMGALNFLNSQASIALVHKHGKSFEAVA